MSLTHNICQVQSLSDPEAEIKAWDLLADLCETEGHLPLQQQHNNNTLSLPPLQSDKLHTFSCIFYYSFSPTR